MQWFEGVHSCKETDSLSVVIEALVKAEVHRLVVTDDDKRVRGIVSLSDILSFLVLRPTLQGNFYKLQKILLPSCVL